MASWTRCSDFAEYVNNVKNTIGEDGLIVSTSLVSAGTTSFSAVTSNASNLLGAVIHGSGSGGAYGHAVVITEATGLSRNQIKISAHTNAHKNYPLFDLYASSALKLFVPSGFRLSSSRQSPQISVDLHEPISRNTTLTLSASTDVSCASIVTTVTSENDITTSFLASNTSQASHNYTFGSTGIYTICVQATQVAGGTDVKYYYTIRVE